MSKQFSYSIVFFLVFVACKPEIKITDLKNGFYRSNYLQIEYSFKTDKVSDAFFKYWPRVDPQNKTVLSSLQTKSHQFILLSLKPDTDYEFQLEVVNGNRITTGPIQNFHSGMAPPSFPKFIVQQFNDEVFDNNIMIRNTADPGNQLMINQQGEINWYHRGDTALFRPFSVLNNNAFVALQSAVEIISMNLIGDTLWHFDAKEQQYDKLFHHEVIKDNDGNYIALTRINKTFDLTKFGGNKKDIVKGDGIVVIGPDKKIIWEWNIFDFLDPTDWQKEGQDINKTKGDWSHANALNIDNDGNYLVSFRSFDQIWKIDKSSGEVIWKLGVDGSFDLNENDLFYKQHAVHINQNGNLMLFDNMGADGKTSRALAFEIDEINKTATNVLDVALPDSLYSAKQGSAYLMGDNKILFCSTGTQSIVITDLEGNLLWFAKSDKPYYRAVTFDVNRGTTSE